MAKNTDPVGDHYRQIPRTIYIYIYIHTYKFFAYIRVLQRSGMFRDGTTLVTHDLHTYCTLYCARIIIMTSKCDQREAAEADVIGEQQLSGHNWGEAAEGEAIGE